MAVSVSNGFRMAIADMPGVILFQEPVTLWRLFFLTTLVLSVVGLQKVSSH